MKGHKKEWASWRWECQSIVWMIILMSRLSPFLLNILMEDVLLPQLCSWCFCVSNSISLWILQPLNQQILSTFHEWFGQTQTYNPLPFCMVLTVPTAPTIQVESFWVDNFKFASILIVPPKFLFGLDFVTRDLKFNCSIFLNNFPLLCCGDNDAFCLVQSKTDSSSDSLFVIGSSCSYSFSLSSLYPYNPSSLLKQKLDKSRLFNPY